MKMVSMIGFLRAMRLYPRPWIIDYGPASLGTPLLIYYALNKSLLWPFLIFMLLVLFLLYSLTFTINYITDVKEDALKDDLGSNPILKGEVEKKELKSFAVAQILILLIITVISGDPVIMVFSLLGLALGLTYSLGPRFKESRLAPLVAMFFFLGPTLMLIAKIWLLNGQVNSLLSFYAVGLFFFALYYEVQHTLFDYRSDLAAMKKTFAVRTGPQRAMTVGGISLSLSLSVYLFVLYSLYPFMVFLLLLSYVMYSSRKGRIMVIYAPLIIALLLRIETWDIQSIVALTLSLPPLILFAYDLSLLGYYYLIKTRDGAKQLGSRFRSKANALAKDLKYLEFYKI